MRTKSRSNANTPNNFISVLDYGARGDGIVDDTVAIQTAIDAVHANGGGTLFIPAGTYNIDGAAENFADTNGGGIELKAHVRLLGDGMDSTILKNVTNNWSKVVGSQGGDNMAIQHLTIDGGRLTHRPVDQTFPTGGMQPIPLRDVNNSGYISNHNDDNYNAQATHDIRGEGFILYNGISSANNLLIDNVFVKNTGHYGIGLQNVEMSGAVLTNLFFENIGGDCIDIKSNTGTISKATVIDNVTVLDGCGHNTPWNNTYGNLGQDTGHVNQACFDIGGQCHVSNVNIRGLDSYPYRDGGETLGAVGLRFRAPVDNQERKGSALSTATNIFVESTKGVDEGAEQEKRIGGVVINDENISISNVTVTGCYKGLWIYNSGDGVPFNVNANNLFITKNTGVTGSFPYAINTAAATKRIYLSGLITDSDIGLHCNGTNNTVNLTIDNCDRAIDLIRYGSCEGSVTLSNNTVNDPEYPEIKDGYNSFVARNLNVLASQNDASASLDLRSLDTSYIDTGTAIGGINVFSDDATGPPSNPHLPLRGRFGLYPTGPSAADVAWRFKFEDEEVLDGNGDPIPLLDGQGNQIPVVDRNGDPVLDGNGDPEIQYEMTAGSDLLAISRTTNRSALPFTLPFYAQADLPAIDTLMKGALVFLNTGTPADPLRLLYCDGVNWRKVEDSSIVV